MTLLETKHLFKSFGGVQAVDGVSLEITPGKIYSLIGPNGAGKTSFFNLLSGFLAPDKGEIFFRGEPITKLEPYQRARHLSRTFQLTRNFRNLSLRDNLLLSFDSPLERLSSFWRYRPAVEREQLGLIRELLGELKFTRELDAEGCEVSYGQAKLLELARSILHHHELLMLDEPVGGVNPEIRGIIKAMLQRLRQQGETILLIEHDMNFVMDMSDHIFVMAEGKLIAEGEPEIIRKDPRVLEAYLGKND